MTARAVPFLTYQPAKGQRADEVMALYTSLFADGEVLSVHRHPDGGPGAGTVALAEFVVAARRPGLS